MQVLGSKHLIRLLDLALKYGRGVAINENVNVLQRTANSLACIDTQRKHRRRS